MQDYINRKADINDDIPSMTIKQYDNNSRKVYISLTDNDNPNEINVNMQGNKVRAYFLLPDKSAEFVDGEIYNADEGIIAVTIPSSVTQQIGTVLCEISITSTDNSTLLSLRTFNINILPSIRDDEAIEATSQFSALEEALITVDGLEARMNSLAALADNGDIPAGTIESEVIDARCGHDSLHDAIEAAMNSGGGDVDAEVTDARTDAKGGSNANLKSRLDKEYNQLSDEIADIDFRLSESMTEISSDIYEKTSNLFDIDLVLKKKAISINSQNKAVIIDDPDWNLTTLIPIDVNTLYFWKVFDFEITSTNGYRIIATCYDENENYLGYADDLGTWGELSFDGNGCKRIKTTNPQCKYVIIQYQVRLDDFSKILLDTQYSEYVEKCAIKFGSKKEIEKIIRLNRYENARVNILGDSMSTFSGYLPDDNLTWYPNQYNDTESVRQTWWYKVIKNLKANLLCNDSFSGSTISTSVGAGRDKNTAFCKRILSSMGSTQITKEKPDIIFVFGGTNDENNSVPIGSHKYSNWSETDIESFSPAYDFMLDYLIKNNPFTRVIVLIPYRLNQNYKDAIIESCKHYEVEYIALPNVAMMNNHPSVSGHAEISEYITNYITQI